MRDEQIIEAMAGIDTEGHKGFWCSECGDIDGANTRNDETCDLCGLPAISGDDYLNDRDAMHRVRRSLTDDELKRVGHELEQMCGNTLHPWVMLARATARDWCEAILKAKGLWK